MGSCIGSCAGSMCMGACCGGGKTKDIRMNFVLILFFNIVLATALRFWGGELVSYISIEDLVDCDTTVCYGFQAVFRISCALAFFFFSLALVSSLAPQATSFLANFCFQMLYYLALLLGFWFVPDTFYNTVYSPAAMYVGGLFLLFQLMLLVSATNDWNDRLVSQESYKTMMGLSVTSYAICLTGIILMFIFFGGNPGCGLQNTTVAITLIAILCTTLLSQERRIVGERGSLLVSAVIGVYAVWMNYSALSSDPSHCNTIVSGGQDLVWLIIGLVWSGISVVYSAWSLGTSESLLAEGDNDLEESLVGEAEDDVQESDSADAAPVKISGAHNIRVFFLVMGACSMYMAMLLTNWRGAEDASLENAVVSNEAMWVQLISEWSTFALYAWVLIAPYLFPNRDF